jgi:sterol desaturase/sphingolipid hydroxylase (fatty acid hydroxylase superfamily)
MHPFNPTHLATPAFIFLVVVEMIFAYATSRARFEARDTAASLMMGFLSVLSGAVFAFVFIALGQFFAGFRIADIGWSWGALLAAFVLDDFAYYRWHRAATGCAGCGPITSSIIPASISISPPPCASR